MLVIRWNSTLFTKFTLPKINVGAKVHYQFTGWQNCHFTEPTVLNVVTDEEIKQISAKGETLQNAVSFPLPYLSSGKAVKSVTEASMLVSGSAERNRVVGNRIE